MAEVHRDSTQSGVGVGAGGVAHPALRALVDRFDAAVIDVPSGSASIRLAVHGVGEWDATIRAGRIELRPAEGSGYDARLSADADTWQQIAGDIKGGMEAYHRGRLRIRRNLHLGVGFLAATSGIVEQGRLRFASVRTPVGSLSTLSAGDGEPVVCIHGLGRPRRPFCQRLLRWPTSGR
jgi:hypothetical protein